MEKIKDFKFRTLKYKQYIIDDVKVVLHNGKYYDSIKLRFICDNINRANGRNSGNPKWPNLVSPFYIYKLGEKQNWRCAYTSATLEFQRGGKTFQNKNANPMSLTIDRIDPRFTYFENNIQLLTHATNTWKSDWTEKNLVRYSIKFLTAYYLNKLSIFFKRTK